MGRGVGLSVRNGWMMGKGQNLRSGYIFIYVKQAEFLLKSIYSTRLFFFYLHYETIAVSDHRYQHGKHKTVFRASNNRGFR